ncbi:MAG: two-component sensor histidine kinase, partial [Sphingopyxis sp.]|nr:two-component sensor histidine kinase [Sphingopyxis sp.]
IRTLARAFNQMGTDLKRLDEERALLLAGVSHDLRTPLSAHPARLEMMDDKGESALKSGMVQDIEDMDAIVGQFLDFVRDGNSEPQVSSDLNAMVQAVCERYARAGHEIQTDFGSVSQLPLRPTAMRR